MAKRSRLDIIYDMLVSIRNKRGKLKPTHLMYKANLSYKQFKLYLEELEAKNLVERITEKKIDYISLTERGYTIISKIEEIREFDDIFGI